MIRWSSSQKPFPLRKTTTITHRYSISAPTEQLLNFYSKLFNVVQAHNPQVSGEIEKLLTQLIDLHVLYLHKRFDLSGDASVFLVNRLDFFWLLRHFDVKRYDISVVV
jgi:hypothetical protein